MATTERAEALLAGPLRVLLVWPWLCYRPLVRIRNLLFDWGLRRSRQLPAPVVSVGNISPGGTGKTPLVALIADELEACGWTPAILSRGYKGDGEANDEARMLARPVVCDPHRHRGGRRALATGARALVLDDGFQHRQLHRDLDLVCIDATRPWGRADGRRGRTLPLGLLREAPAALRRADLLVITRCDQVPASHLDHLLRGLARYGKPVLRCRHRPSALRILGAASAQDPSSLAGRRLVLVSGIGNPKAFATTVRDLGGQIVAEHRFDDHHAYSPDQVTGLLAAAGADPLLITAKDAVKWLDLVPLAERGRVLVLEVTASLEDGDLLRLRAALGSVLEPSRSDDKLPGTA